MSISSLFPYCRQGVNYAHRFVAQFDHFGYKLGWPNPYLRENLCYVSWKSFGHRCEGGSGRHRVQRVLPRRHRLEWASSSRKSSKDCLAARRYSPARVVYCVGYATRCICTRLLLPSANKKHYLRPNACTKQRLTIVLMLTGSNSHPRSR